MQRVTWSLFTLHFFSSQKYILTSSAGRHFIGKKILIEAMKSLYGEQRKHPKIVMAWTTLLDDECAIPLLKQLTMNAVRLNTAKCSKIIVVQRWMNQNLHSTLPINTSKIQAAIFRTRSLPYGRMKSRSYFWKLLKTIPFAEFVFQSYSIQTYLWLCSSGKWLPEREKSQDLYKSASIQLQRRMSF